MDQNRQTAKQSLEKWQPILFFQKYLHEIIIGGGIAFFRVLYFANETLGHIYPDSEGYINYRFFTATRPPGYPLYIDVFQVLLRDNFALGVVMGQIIISFFSLFWFYKTLLIIISKSNEYNNINRTTKRFASFVTLLYGCNPAVFIYDVCICSDSLSLSCTIFFIYFAVRWVVFSETKYGLLSIIAIWISIMIKVALAVYAGDFLILLLLMAIDKKRRKQILGKIGVSFSMLLFFCAVYIGAVYSKSGVLNFSDLAPRHSLDKCLTSGLYKNFWDQNLVEKINVQCAETGYSGWHATTPVMQLFGEDIKTINKKVQEFTSYCIRSDIPKFMSYMTEVALQVKETQFNDAFSIRLSRNKFLDEVMNFMESIFQLVKVSHVYAVGCILLIWGIYLWIKENMCPYLILGISGGIISVVVSVLLGTYGEWVRTMVYVLPFTYVGVVLMFKEIIMRERK